MAQAVNEVFISLLSNGGDFTLFSQRSLCLPLRHCSGPSSAQECHLPSAPPVQVVQALPGSAGGSPSPPPTLNAFSEIVPAPREVMYTYHLTQTIPGHTAHAATSPPSSLLVNILHSKLGCGLPTRHGGYPITGKEAKDFRGVWGLVVWVFCPP